MPPVIAEVLERHDQRLSAPTRARAYRAAQQRMAATLGDRGVGRDGYGLEL
jgi:hypothetical protein